MQKTLSALVHFEAREKDLLAVERVQARKSPQCIQGGGDVHPGQVEAPDKVLLAVERVQALDKVLLAVERVQAS